jgi:hypothetical protein
VWSRRWGLTLDGDRCPWALHLYQVLAVEAVAARYGDYIRTEAIRARTSVPEVSL